MPCRCAATALGLRSIIMNVLYRRGRVHIARHDARVVLDALAGAAGRVQLELARAVRGRRGGAGAVRAGRRRRVRGALHAARRAPHERHLHGGAARRRRCG